MKDEQLPLAGTEEAEILARLSERVERAVAMIQELRKERDELRAKLAEHTTLEEEHDRFKQERGEIRDRIETILHSLERLEEG
jgi:hypothetical protein